MTRREVVRQAAYFIAGSVVIAAVTLLGGVYGWPVLLLAFPVGYGSGQLFGRIINRILPATPRSTR